MAALPPRKKKMGCFPRQRITFKGDADYLSVMSKQEVLTEAARRNMLLSPEALELIMSNSEPVAFTEIVLKSLAKNTMLVTKQDVLNCVSGDMKIFEAPKEIKPANKFYSDLHIVPDTDITGNSTCEGTIDDILRFFQSRYTQMKKIIERKKGFGLSMPIAKAVDSGRDEVRVVGMISSKRVLDNKSVMLDIEDDLGGKCSVYIPSDNPWSSAILVEDQVIGVVGRPRRAEPSKRRRGSINATEIVFPDVPANNRWQPSDSSSCVAFLSDVHVGSTTFLDKNWHKMIQWLKENSETINLNYIIFPGDVVDGIGIFPDQEKELTILDIYKQYDALAEYLKDIPDHIKMVVHPGNHDACRPAEPQPALNKIYTKTFDSNIIMCGNPVYVEAEGRKILTYHGRSIDDWVSGVQQLTYDHPVQVMEQMVTMRHLAPMYGQKTALAPEKKDYLVMDTVPDIFVSGHVHGAGYEDYKGVKLINASTWQTQTEYQKMHNFNPDPGIMPIVNLGTGRVTMKSFMD